MMIFPTNPSRGIDGKGSQACIQSDALDITCAIRLLTCLDCAKRRNQRTLSGSS